MKTKTIAATALIAIILAIGTTAAIADSGMMAGHSQSEGDNNQGNEGDHANFAACMNATTGQTLTVTNLTGHYLNATSHETDDAEGLGGNASGTFTFTVSSVYAEGCTLSVTGSFKLNSTTYTISGGTIVSNQEGSAGTGSGTTSGGSLLISVDGLHGNSTSAHVGAVRLDFKTGASQFLVLLHSPSVGDDQGESD